ncbi:hypothetical protein K1T71_000350 [Dendrolimus kikuchii]|uniref:Uncharacterized protein n=1 Tax=Dendrolimus kikuchii TaxID=765133 RepID=A0ACC1DJY4_9NEOP|nr:hypothetical protein K1T71_000350 [Dendrolimus kikuchii]
MIKSVFVIAVLLFATVRASPVVNKVAINQFEEGCIRQGGICIRLEECDPTNLVRIGETSLCPLQRNLGAVCCYI